MKKIITLTAASLFLMTSCGVAGVVSTPSNYVSAGKEVRSVKKNTNILGLTPMDSQAKSGEALSELETKCTDGVTNIRTTVSSKVFILGFEKLEVTGNCK